VLRARHDWITAPGRRVRAALWPSVLAAVAAALAWLIAHRVLGHSDPFFAPVAATISLGTLPRQRSHRIVQMVLGVLLGIAVGTLFSSVLGVSTPVLGLTVLVALLAGRALGAGFVGDGMMLVNQAASSAVIVAILHHTGTGAERAVDAAVGGAVALVIGVGLFPTRPLPPLRAAERALLGSVAAALEGLGSLLSAGTPAEPTWTLATAHDIHQRLAELTAARSSARLIVRVAPRRWALRAIVDAEDLRLARLHLLADAALGLVRAGTAALEDRQPLAASLERHIAALATAMSHLASTPHPWPPGLMSAVEEVTQRAISEQAGERADWPPVVAAGLRTTARDLQDVTSCLLGPGKTVPSATPADEPRREHVAVARHQARRSP
jgi:uncharacterized membrane protein YgaE (UPF0421/DUF939 family)